MNLKGRHTHFLPEQQVDSSKYRSQKVLNQPKSSLVNIKNQFFVKPCGAKYMDRRSTRVKGFKESLKHCYGLGEKINRKVSERFSSELPLREAKREHYQSLAESSEDMR